MVESAEKAPPDYVGDVLREVIGDARRDDELSPKDRYTVMISAARGLSSHLSGRHGAEESRGVIIAEVDSNGRRADDTDDGPTDG